MSKNLSEKLYIRVDAQLKERLDNLVYKTGLREPDLVRLAVNHFVDDPQLLPRSASVETVNQLAEATNETAE